MLAFKAYSLIKHIQLSDTWTEGFALHGSNPHCSWPRLLKGHSRQSLPLPVGSVINVIFTSQAPNSAPFPVTVLSPTLCQHVPFASARSCLCLFPEYAYLSLGCPPSCLPVQPWPTVQDPIVTSLMCQVLFMPLSWMITRHIANTC